LYQRGLVAGRDGNVSQRIGSDRILITPTGVNKGYLSEDLLVETDLDGTPVRGGTPSGEIFLHKAVYRHHPEARAVVHAHPPVCVALTLAGHTMEEPLIPRIIATLGAVATVPYATPQTPELAELLVPYLSQGPRALLLDRHGSITMGQNVLEAYDYLDSLEHAARIVAQARTLSPAGLPRLDTDEIRRLKS
jgi:L-fuculose-phosphate aldolase